MWFATEERKFTVFWDTAEHNKKGAVDYYNLEVWNGSTLLHEILQIRASSYGVSSGVTSGTTYRIKLYSRDKNHNTVWLEPEAFVTTDSPPEPPAGMGFISVSSITGVSFQLSWGAVSRATSYRVTVREGHSGGSLAGSWSPSGTSQSVTGLKNGTSYWIQVYGVNSTGSGSANTTSTTTLSLPATPTNFRVYDKINDTSLSLAWQTVSGATKYVVEAYRSSNSSLVWSNYNISGGSVLVSGLLKGVTYDLKLYANNVVGNSIPVWLYNVRAGLRPIDWGWTLAKEKGRSYAISNSRFTNLVTYDEIIAFRSRINEFRIFKNLEIYNFSTITRGSTFTATMYNQMETAIRAMNPPTSTYGQQSAGSSLTVDILLNRLRDSLNSIE